jgi:sporulation protein YlmC with PRC-barrel domain
MTSVFPVSPLESVREGMTIVDAQNRPLGTVTHVFPGSPNAVTTNENDLASGQVGMIIAPLENTGGTSTVGVAFPWVVDGMLNDPALPDELRLEHLRTGFVELDGPGVRGLARYIHGDQIDEVAGDVVRLKATYHMPTTGGGPKARPRVVLGATVRTADGHEVGKVDRLIVDPYTLSIRALVIRKGFILSHSVEIPLIAIQGGTETELRLRYSADQVRRLPEFVDAHYAEPPTGYVPPAAYTRDLLLWPLGVPLLPPPPPRRDETAVRWGMNNAEITEGSDVVTADGVKLGEVHAVALNPITRRPVSFVVRRGFLFAREVELSVERVREVGDRVVHVDLEADEARGYAQAGPSFRPEWSRFPG